MSRGYYANAIALNDPLPYYLLSSVFIEAVWKIGGSEPRRLFKNGSTKKRNHSKWEYIIVRGKLALDSDTYNIGGDFFNYHGHLAHLETEKATTKTSARSPKSNAISPILVAQN